MLKTTHIVKNRRDKTYTVFTRNISNNFITDPTLPATMTPSEYVRECWRRYLAYAAAFPQNNSLNGKIFETIIATELYRKNIRPFYQQAKITFVPNVDYDIVLYDIHRNIPIALSIKTSTRERYKQADLESVALKYVHRKAETDLVMLDPVEATNLKLKLASGDLLGIDKIIQADTVDFDDMINRLRTYTFGLPTAVNIVSGTVV